MNKRIKLLADQAEDYATAEYEKWIPTPDFSGIPHIRKIFNEKFAELIVQECAGICHKMAEDSDSYVVHDGDTCAEQIKKHFGVEE